MSRPGTCEAGCAEYKLLVVQASTVDALERAECEVLASIAALRPAAEELANPAADPESAEHAYGALCVRARQALAHPLDNRTAAYVLDEPAAPTITWWCDRCGGVDAPQPCLGICVWRTVEWTRFDIYTQLRHRVIAEYETERRLRSLLWRIVHTSPRPGQHLRTWTAYAQDAEKVLGRRLDAESSSE